MDSHTFYLASFMLGRFRWYRQVNGRNFYMSAKQVLQAEKKIKTLSLIQLQAIMSASVFFAHDSFLDINARL